MTSPPPAEPSNPGNAQDEATSVKRADDKVTRDKALLEFIIEFVGYFVIGGLMWLVSYLWHRSPYLTLLGLVLLFAGALIWFRRFRQILLTTQPPQSTEDKTFTETSGWLIIGIEAAGYLVIGGLACLMSFVWHRYSLLTLLGLLLLSAGVLIAAVGALVWHRRSRQARP